MDKRREGSEGRTGIGKGERKMERRKGKDGRNRKEWTKGEKRGNLAHIIPHGHL